MANMTQAEVAEIKTLLATPPSEEPTQETEVTDENQEVTEEESIQAEPSNADLDAIDDGVVPEEEAEVNGNELEADVVPEEYTITSLAEAIELEPAELYAVKVPIGNGIEPMSIGELKHGYQDMQSKVAELETQLSEVPDQSVNRAVSQFEQNIQFEMQSIQKEFDGTDWADLEEYEPAQAVLKRQKLQDRWQTAQSQIGQVAQHQQQEHDSQMQQAWNTTLDLIPQWQDATVRDTDVAAISDILTGVGYPSEMVGMIEDPLAMSLLRELASLRAEKSAGRAAVKQVRKAPKVVKSSGKQAAPVDNSRADALVKKARTSGDKNDKHNAIKAILQGG